MGELANFFDPEDQKEIKLLDPNILAAPNAMELLQQLVDSGAWIDFTQGLDIRLFEKQHADLIKQMKVKKIHFALDSMKNYDSMIEKFKQVKKWLKFSNRKMGVYVLTNFDTSWEDDLLRIYTLKEIGFKPFVMIFDKPLADQKFIHLQRWVNAPQLFMTIETFEEYMEGTGEHEKQLKLEI